MAAGTRAESFALLTSDFGRPEIARIAEELAGVERIQAFMASYRARLEESACGAVVRVRLMALPAKFAARIMASRDSPSGLWTARGKCSTASSIASAAKRCDSGVDRTAQYDSMPCANASIPVTAVSRGQTESVKAGSTMLKPGSIDS